MSYIQEYKINAGLVDLGSVGNWPGDLLEIGRESIFGGLFSTEEILSSVLETAEGVQSLVGTLISNETMNFYDPLDMFFKGPVLTPSGEHVLIDHSRTMLTVLNDSSRGYYQALSETPKFLDTAFRVRETQDERAERDAQEADLTEIVTDFVKKVRGLGDTLVDEVKAAEGLAHNFAKKLDITIFASETPLSRVSRADFAKEQLAEFDKIFDVAESGLTDFSDLVKPVFNKFKFGEIASAANNALPSKEQLIEDLGKLEVEKIKKALDDIAPYLPSDPAEIGVGASEDNKLILIVVVSTMSGAKILLEAQSQILKYISKVVGAIGELRDELVASFPFDLAVQGGVAIGAKAGIELKPTKLASVMTAAIKLICGIIQLLIEILLSIHSILKQIFDAGSSIAKVALK